MANCSRPKWSLSPNVVSGQVDQQRTSSFVTHQLFEKTHEKNMPMYAVLVEFAKTFDSVDFGLLWEVLAHQSVPPKFLNALRNLHRNMEGCVSYGRSC